MTAIWHKLSWTYLRNNLQTSLFLTFYLILLLFFGVNRYLLYLEANVYLATARAFGLLLNITIAVSITLVCRNLISSLYSFGLGSYLPLDHYIYFHKLTGWLIAVFSLGHTIGHLLNMKLISTITTLNYMDLLWNPALGIGWIWGAACLTGWLLCGVLVIIVVFSMSFIRRSGRFELFFYTHLLYIPFLVLAIIHAPKVIFYVSGPIVVYISERIFRYLRSVGSNHGNTYALYGSLLPSRVLRLEIVKPPNFKFNSGDFVYVNVPSITKREWHPITISSAPEDLHITLHIRAVGEWTNRLYQRFEATQSSSIKDYIRNYQEPIVITMSNMDPSSSTSSSTTLQSSDTGFADHCAPKLPASTIPFDSGLSSMVEVIKKDQLATRTCIIRIPKGCNETGCPPKKLRSFTDRRKDSEGFELVPLNDNEDSNNNNVNQTLHDRNSNQIHHYDYEASNDYNYASYKSYKKNIDDSVVNPLSTGDANGRDTKGFYITNNTSQMPMIRVLKSLVDLGTQNTVTLAEPLVLHLDGPFGAPSSNIFKAEHAVLISTGIGVTPFASILQSIIHRYTELQRSCPSCSHTWYEKILSSMIKLRKVDFIWINRDHSSFEWFIEKLDQHVQEQLLVPGSGNESKERFLDIHLYVTGQLKESFPSRFLEFHNSRPDWDDLFEKIRLTNHGKVTVFYCGRADLAAVVRTYCNKFNFAFKKEVF